MGGVRVPTSEVRSPSCDGGSDRGPGQGLLLARAQLLDLNFSARDLILAEHGDEAGPPGVGIPESLAEVPDAPQRVGIHLDAEAAAAQFRRQPERLRRERLL